VDSANRRSGREAGVVLWQFLAVVVSVFVTSTLLRSFGPGVLLPLLPLIPLTAIGLMRYSQMRERRQQMSCPNCGLRLSYRPLSRSHGMLECPLLCGYRRLVGDPRGGR
jgi:predicted RNA-binding Zn-ribbon protein involved in translation (DUF1610 family)